MTDKRLFSEFYVYLFRFQTDSSKFSNPDEGALAFSLLASTNLTVGMNEAIKQKYRAFNGRRWKFFPKRWTNV